MTWPRPTFGFQRKVFETNALQAGHVRELAPFLDFEATYWHARNDWWRPQGPWDPMDAIADIMHWARQAFPKAFEPGGRPCPANPVFTIALRGC